MTNVGPGSRSHSSFSSARRYLARIFVACSISAMSMRARIRASRRVAPISGMRPEGYWSSGAAPGSGSGGCVEDRGGIGQLHVGLRSLDGPGQ